MVIPLYSGNTYYYIVINVRTYGYPGITDVAETRQDGFDVQLVFYSPKYEAIGPQTKKRPELKIVEMMNIGKV